MRIPWLSIALITCVKAQYFSEGWKPGSDQDVSSDAPNIAQGVTKVFGAQPPQQTQESSPPQAVSQKPKRLSELLDFTWVLTSSPVSSLFSTVGINITEKVAKAKESPWDVRIPLITDDNYETLIVNEPLTEEEEKARTWVLIVSGDYSQGGLSPVIDGIFDQEFNETMTVNDLPHVRWARIDYLKVTYLTTKWATWQVPTLVVLKDRGQTLRFYRPQYLRIGDGRLREFLKEEYYLKTTPWNSDFAPGGSKEYILHYYGYALMKIYGMMVAVPRWLLYILSGTIASTVIQFLHRPRAQSPPITKGDNKTTPSSAAERSQSVTGKTSSGVEEGVGGAAKRRKAKK
ncbi:hypothetical protein E1B28_004798 [Marasmius oreades]|uniref:Thioredoxin-like fold domain-containing protein n=1 Tax=Marasmius oreades TaxID=181124 RepID=A0A9P8ADG7_9AGAR|nr:uncharacterized protein E1B28_004798 [Marasmius oreades]KAG7097453.1 hypothetical protein E1B28_004798 [Marasmius oreades]